MAAVGEVTDLRDLDSRAAIHDLVVGFYREIVFDDLLEPVFGEVAEVDWAEHIPRLIAYWQRVANVRHKATSELGLDDRFSAWRILSSSVGAAMTSAIGTTAMRPLNRRRMSSSWRRCQDWTTMKAMTIRNDAPVKLEKSLTLSDWRMASRWVAK